MACRKTVQGILKFTAPVFWNVTIKQVDAAVMRT